MNIKIPYHIMPWEIDYALLSFTQLKKSKYYIQEEVNIEINSVLNLSSYIIDWDKSKLPKEYFIEKYKNISKLLIDYNHTTKIFEGDTLYGHLELQRDCIEKHIDYYVGMCPDMYFSEYLLSYLIEGAKQIKNKYFVLTPQIHKLWDDTWDEITDPEYIDVPYDKWDKADVFSIRNHLKNSDKEIALQPTQRSKWAGWFDLYNKAFYEELCPIHNDWKGYGPWDFYSLLLTEYIKTQGIDFQQYLLEGQTIFEYSVGPLKDWNNYYKENNLLKIKDVPNQREIFEGNMQLYLNKGIKLLKNKKVL